MRSPRVLVVEDEVIVAEDVRGRLRQMGYSDCRVAMNSSQAIDLARQCKPDIILMDIKLNDDRDGIETARCIREQQDIPIVYLTAYSDDETILRAKKTRPYSYLLKPCEDRELKTSIEMSLHRHQVENQLRSKSRWLATTLQSIGDGMIATDSHGLTQMMNPAARQMTNWPENENFHLPIGCILNLQDEQTGASYNHLIAQAIEKRKTLRLPDHAALINHNGRKIPVICTIAPIQTEPEECIGAILVFQDNTRRRNAELKLTESRREIELKNIQLQALVNETRHLAAQARLACQFKSRFLAGISQEINGPLNTIASFCELMQQNKLPADQDNLSIIHSSARGLLNLTHDLLDYSRIESGELDISIADHPLNDMLNGIDLRIRAAASNKGLSFHIMRQSLLPAIIRTDAIRLKQCLLNMLEPAIDHTHSGHVHLTVTTSLLNGQPAILFEIEDSGPPLTAEELQRLHDPVFPDNLPHPQCTDHNRLGLAVAKHLAGLLGGVVAWRHHPAGGNLTSLLLQTGARPAISGLQGGSSLLDEAPQKPFHFPPDKTVLAVDDHPSIQALIHILLSRAGIHCVTASDGESAFDLLRHRPIDLILMDIQLPGANGYEITRQLRAGGFDLPIIAISAAETGGDRQQALQAGCNEYLTKPLEKEPLYQLLEKYLTAMPAAV